MCSALLIHAADLDEGDRLGVVGNGLADKHERILAGPVVLNATVTPVALTVAVYREG